VSLVTFLPRTDSDAPSMSQWAQLGIYKIGPLAYAWKTSACKSISMFSVSSCVNGRSMRYACPLDQWKLKVIPSHHRTIRSWIAMIRSQSPFVLWKIQPDVGHLVAVTDDSLSHTNRTDHIFMAPARYNVPRTAIPTTGPPSSDQYEAIRHWIPSSGPSPRRRFFSSLVTRTHPWYPTPNIRDLYAATTISTGYSKSNVMSFICASVINHDITKVMGQ
jgi:hypothetical protein